MQLDSSVVFIREPNEQTEMERAAILGQMRADIGKELADLADHQSRQLTYKAVEEISRNKAAFYENELTQKAITLSSAKGQTYAQISQHPKFKDLLEKTAQLYPLVVLGTTRRFTTQSMLADEQEMLELAGVESGKHILDVEIVREAIASKAGISAEQIEVALQMMQSPNDVSVGEGYAGAGKSFTMEAVRYGYEKAGYDVIGTAISWTAAKVLQASAKLSNSMALARLLNQMAETEKSGGEFFHRPTCIIVDEAGMVDTLSMARLLKYCNKSRYPVKVILTGDTLQVTPVSAGAAMEAIVEKYGSGKITTIRRQVSESDRICVKLLSERKAGRVVHMMAQKESFVWAQNREDQIARIVEGAVSYRLAFPKRSSLILGVDNKTVREVNDRIRDAFKRLGLIQREEVANVKVTDGREVFEASFSVGDDVVLRGNNPDIPVYKIDPHKSPVDEKQWEKLDRVGVFNRNSGRIVGIRKCDRPLGSYDFIVDLVGDLAGRVIINSEEFRKQSLDQPRGLPMTLNYATTVYASQGMTVDQVFFLDGEGMNFRLAYVGLSRHRDNVKVYLDINGLHNRIDGKSKYKSRAIQEHPELLDNVQAHRHSFQTMLQEVAKGWAKNSENLTATLLQLRHMRHGSDNERRQRADFQREEADKIRLQPISKQMNDAVWNSDLRATVLLEASEPLEMAQLWLAGSNLDATALCSAAGGLVKLCAWLKEPELEAQAQAVHTAMLAQRPAAGLWDIQADAEGGGFVALATEFRTACETVVEALNNRPAIGQEVLDRVTANPEDSLSRSMTNNVRIYVERYDTVNMDEVLKLDMPLQTPEDLTESEIDLERLATPVQTIPLPERNPEEASQSFMTRLFGSFLGGSEPEKLPPVRSQPIAQQPKRARAFGESSVQGKQAIQEPAPSGLPSLMRAARSWLLDAPKPTRDVPYRENPVPLGFVTPGGLLDFTNVPKTPNLEGKAPSEEFIRYLRGRWWTRGKFNEPRILAKDDYGNFRGRYSLDGELVAGEHYPPAIFNQRGNAQDTGVRIVAGPLEMAMLVESRIRATQQVDEQNQPKVDPASVPHVFWDAKGADWGMVARDLATTRDVAIVRAANDPGQEKWARDLQLHLLQHWDLQVAVQPPLPEALIQATPPVQVPRPRLRSGRP